MVLGIIMHGYTTPKEIIFIIHGTWAHKKFEEHWYNPDGYFFNAIEKQLKKEDTVLVPFLWSGNNTPQARESAANVLTKSIESYPLDTTITIIAHSHGATVGVLASQKLGLHKNNEHRISRFYSLGRPVDNKLHMPDMNVIDYFYNFFSYNDSVQRVFGAYEREVLPQHSRIANIRVILNGKDPNHSELHHASIGQWIYSIHDIICLNKAFEFCEPAIVHFYDNKAPQHLLDTERITLRQKDQRVTNAIIHAFKIGAYTLKKAHANFKNKR